MRWLSARFPASKLALFVYDYSDFETTHVVAEDCLSNFCCAQHAAQAIVGTLNSIIQGEVEEPSFHDLNERVYDA
jgi:hypothetical protein